MGFLGCLVPTLLPPLRLILAWNLAFLGRSAKECQNPSGKTCGAVKIAAIRPSALQVKIRKISCRYNSSYIPRPTAVILVVVEQLVVGQASLLYNLVIGEVDFAEAVADFHVEDVTGNVCDITAEVSDNLAHLVRRCANDGRNLAVSVLAVFQRVQTIHIIVLDGVRIFARSGSKVANCVFDTYDFVLHFCTLTFFFRGVFTAPVL